MRATTICRRCGADILWARTAKGRSMPVDPQPRPDGNLAVYRDHLGTLRARVVTAEHPIEAYERPGMPHAATCVPRDAKPGVTPQGAILRKNKARKTPSS